MHISCLKYPHLFGWYRKINKLWLNNIVTLYKLVLIQQKLCNHYIKKLEFILPNLPNLTERLLFCWSNSGAMTGSLPAANFVCPHDSGCSCFDFFNHISRWAMQVSTWSFKNCCSSLTPCSNSIFWFQNSSSALSLLRFHLSFLSAHFLPLLGSSAQPHSVSWIISSCFCPSCGASTALMFPSSSCLY